MTHLHRSNSKTHSLTQAVIWLMIQPWPEEIYISQKSLPPNIFINMSLYSLQSSKIITGSLEVPFLKSLWDKRFLWPCIIHSINQFFKESVYRQVITVSGLQKHVQQLSRLFFYCFKKIFPYNIVWVFVKLTDLHWCYVALSECLSEQF